MQIHKLDNDLFVCIGDAYDSNSTILLNGKEALLIDSMASRKDSHELQDFVEVKLQKSVKFIICTHYFSDHLAGLERFPSAHFIAHENYKHTFDSELHRSDEEASFYAEPSLLISNEMKIQWGRFHLELFYNPGHTMSMLNVDIPEADLVHVGDTLVGNMVYFKYSYPSAFFPAFEKIKERGRKRLLSSHANVRDITAVDLAGYYLGALLLESSQAWLEGSEENILKIKLRDCFPDGVPATPFENIFHKRNLKTILERRYFEPETLPEKGVI